MHLLVYILVLSTLISTLYWIVLCVKLVFYKESIRYVNLSSPSILLSAKNEEEILPKTLESLSKQLLYKEIIVMDDYSTDKTPQILELFAYKYDKFKTFLPSSDIPGKKQSLSDGISHSRSEYLVFTDADCQPASDKWSSMIMGKMSTDSQLVLGYGPLYKRKGFLNLFARFETVFTALQYLGFHLLGQTYMGVGRNMAYAKELFNKVKGFSSHQHIASGDDDLFVQEAAQHTSTSIILHPESFVYSEAPDTFKKYLNQKKRHIGSSSAYRWKHKIMLSIHPVFMLLSFVTSFILLLSGYIKLVVGIWITRWIILMLIGYIPFKRLDGKDLIKWIPILDIVLIIYYIYFGLTGISSKNARWQT